MSEADDINWGSNVRIMPEICPKEYFSRGLTCHIKTEQKRAKPDILGVFVRFFMGKKLFATRADLPISLRYELKNNGKSYG